MNVLKYVKAQWDRALAIVSVAMGALALLLGWLGVSGTPYPAAQMSYVVSGAIGGVFLLGIAATLWLSADLRDEWRKLDALKRAMETGERLNAGSDSNGSSGSHSATADSQLHDDADGPSASQEIRRS